MQNYQNGEAIRIKTVAVYSDADRYALNVKSADEAVYTVPPARLSYLNSSLILDAAFCTGAQAMDFYQKVLNLLNSAKTRVLLLLDPSICHPRHG